MAKSSNHTRRSKPRNAFAAREITRGSYRRRQVSSFEPAPARGDNGVCGLSCEILRLSLVGRRGFGSYNGVSCIAHGTLACPARWGDIAGRGDGGDARPNRGRPDQRVYHGDGGAGDGGCPKGGGGGLGRRGPRPAGR